MLIFLFTGCVGGIEALKPAPSLSTPIPSPKKTAEPIRIQPEELQLSVGDTASLVCQSTSGQSIKDVIWIIENENIATITGDGTVTAVSEGETTAIAERKGTSGNRATCPITVGEQKALVAANGAKIEINDKIEDFIAQDGTKCVMIFEMQSVTENGVFKGQAMLQSVGVKDAGSVLPAVGMVGLVSEVEFTLDPAASEEPPTVEVGDDEFTLAPLVDVDYRGRGTFRFILTDVGFMALEIEVEDKDILLEVPFEVVVTGDNVGIGFSAPDGQFLSFQGKLTQKP